MAFQGNAFQNDAFQLAPGEIPPPQLELISDGNEVVQFLHEHNQAYTDLDYGTFVPPPIPDVAVCQYPDVKSVTQGSDVSGTNHTVTLPSFAAGDRLLLIDSHGGSGTTSDVTTAGWTQLVATSRAGANYKDMDGSEGATINLRTSAASRIAWVFYVIRAGTFNASVAPQLASNTGTSTTPDPAILTATWVADKSLWFVSYGTDAVETTSVWPTGYVNGNVYLDDTVNTGAAGYAPKISNSENPSTFTKSGGTAWTALTIAVLGICDLAPLTSTQDCDSQDFTDFTDYSFVGDPVGEDGCPTPVFIGVLSANNTSASCVASLPSGASGDLLIAIINLDTNTTSTTPTGWVKFSPSGSALRHLYYKNCDGTETSTETFTLGVSAAYRVVVYRFLARTFSGAPTYGEATATSTTPNPPSLTIPSTSDRAAWIAYQFNNASGGASASAFPTGYTVGQTNYAGFSVSFSSALLVTNTNVEDPGTFTISNQTWFAGTIGLAGWCPSQFLNQECDTQDFSDTSDYYSFDTGPVGEDFVAPVDILWGDGSGLDTQDFTDFADYGYASDPVDAPTDCVYPTIVSTASGNTLTGANVDLTMPSGVVAGDLLTVFIAHSNGNNVSANDPNWNKLFSTNSSAPNVAFFWKFAEGTEGATQSFHRSSGTAITGPYIVYRISGHDTGRAPQNGTIANFTTSSQAPSSFDPTWGADATLWLGPNAYDSTTATITTFPTVFSSNQTVQTDATDNYSVTLPTYQSSDTSLAPSAWVMSVSTNICIGVIAIKGACNLASTPVSCIDSDSQDFTDFADYGSQSDPLSEDAPAVVEETAKVEVDDQDQSDTFDYYSFDAGPVGADNNPDLCIDADEDNDDQDFTDFADYGTQTNVPIPDNNPDICVAAIAIDDQDFTDFADYGTQTDVPIDDNNPDVQVDADEDNDDQDFSDTSDYYSFDSGPVVDDVNPDICVSSIDSDSQDFTDFADYGYASDPFADAVTVEDWLWSVVDYDDQDWSDTSDYYSFDSGPVVDDNPIDILWGVEVDDQDFTDFADYSSQTDVPIPDNNPDICVASIDSDSQDFTDFADYGTQTDVPINDNNPDVCVAAIALDDQDFTDFADYGTQTDVPINDNNPDVCVAAIALDDQDFTDFADYGTLTTPTIEENTFQDWLWGIDCDDQDFTDLADYSFDAGPVGADNNPDGPPPSEDYSTVDDSDRADYGSQSDPLAPDNNPERGLASTALDDQDFTDFADYGSQFEPERDEVFPVSEVPPGPSIYQGVALNRSIRLPDEVNDLMRLRRLQLERRMKQLRENERRKRLLLAMIHALGILDDE